MSKVSILYTLSEIATGQSKWLAHHTVVLSLDTCYRKVPEPESRHSHSSLLYVSSISLISNMIGIECKHLVRAGSDFVDIKFGHIKFLFHVRSIFRFSKIWVSISYTCAVISTTRLGLLINCDGWLSGRAHNNYKIG